MPPWLWADFPIQYIVPAIVLVVWVFNQVFGREGAAGQAVPRREWPRPAMAPAGPPRGPARPPTRSEPSMSWSEIRGQTSPRGGAAVEMVIGPESERARDGTPRTGRSERGSARKKAAKGRGGASGRGVEANPSEFRLTDAAIARDLGLTGAPPELSPSRGPVSDHVDPLRAMLQDPERVRQAILLNEILRPPLSARRFRGGGPSGDSR